MSTVLFAEVMSILDFSEGQRGKKLIEAELPAQIMSLFYFKWKCQCVQILLCKPQQPAAIMPN